jgi:hypothetical protein
MTDEQRAKLAAIFKEAFANQTEMNKTIAKLLRLTLRVLEAEPSPYSTVEQRKKRAVDRKALPGALREAITLLEKE